MLGTSTGSVTALLLLLLNRNSQHSQSKLCLCIRLAQTFTDSSIIHRLTKSPHHRITNTMYALADCNNFFVSCERVFRPDLNDRPVIVLSNNDGCAIARSNEAKALGIKMGDPLFKIRHLVQQHHVAVFSGNMALYDDFSQRVRWTLQEFSPLIEVYSIDEAFLDLRGLLIDDYHAYAKTISQRCYRYTSIPVSVGVAPTKTLAKIASKLCKQYPKLQGGCFLHRSQDVDKVLKRIPLADVWGIGRQSVKRWQQVGIATAYDFAQLSQERVNQMMGINGVRTWKELKGIPCIEFEHTPQIRQSICVSRSFASELKDMQLLAEQVANFAMSGAEKLRKQGEICAEMTVFITTNRFREDEPQTMNSNLVCFITPTNDQRTIVSAAVKAVKEIFSPRYGYKRAGVVFNKLQRASHTMYSLFEDVQHREKEQKLSQVMDRIRGAFGKNALTLASQGGAQVYVSSNHKSPAYTTQWSELPKVTVR